LVFVFVWGEFSICFVGFFFFSVGVGGVGRGWGGGGGGGGGGGATKLNYSSMILDYTVVNLPSFAQ